MLRPWHRAAVAVAVAGVLLTVAGANAAGDDGDALERHAYPSEEDLYNFLEWFEEQGGYLHPSLKIRYRRNRRSDSYFSVIAQTSIPKGDVTVSVPKALLLHSHTREDLARMPRLLDEMERLALKVAEEDVKGEESFWWPYLQVLPRRFHTPLWFNDDELRALSDARGVQSSQDAVDAAAEDLFAGLGEDAETEQEEDVGAGQKLQSMASQVAAEEARKFEEFVGKVDWLLNGNHTELTGEAESERFEAERARLSAALNRDRLQWAWGVVASRAFFVTRGMTRAESHPLHGAPLLAPGADFFDHSSDAPLSHTHLTGPLVKDDPDSVEFRYHAASAVPPGGHAQIFTRYGNHSNAQLLRDYGFVEEENIWDHIKLSVSLRADDPALYEWKKKCLDLLGLSTTLTLTPIGADKYITNTMRVLAFESATQHNWEIVERGLEEGIGAERLRIADRQEIIAIQNTLAALEEFASQYLHTLRHDEELLEEIEDEEDDEERTSFNMELAIRARYIEKAMLANAISQTHEAFHVQRQRMNAGLWREVDADGQCVPQQRPSFVVRAPNTASVRSIVDTAPGEEYLFPVA